MTGWDGLRAHHVAFAPHQKHNIIAMCDKMGTLRNCRTYRRGPRPRRCSDPDGHRVEIYTRDFWTGAIGGGQGMAMGYSCPPERV